MEPMVVGTLPDNLVVEILSRLPFKSFCRFKCVCKSWLAFSSNPNYHENLPKIPTGLFGQYQDLNKKATKLIGQPRKVEQIDGALSFLPQYPQLELVDCCNGLVLCMRRSMDWSNRKIIYHFIVCNPATQEWTKLPDTRPYQEHGICQAMLVFNPSCSRQFYVLNFKRDPSTSFLSGLEVFSSNLSTWLVHDAWWNSGMPTVIGYRHLFIDGSLYLFSLRRNSRRILVLNGFEAMSSCIPPNRRTIKLPNDPSVESPNGLSVGTYTQGFFGHSLGALHFALPDVDGRAIRIWSLDVSGPYKWSMKHRLSIRDAFGRDDLSHYDSTQQCRNCAYRIGALDLESDVMFLFAGENKLRSYAISTGKFHELGDIEQDHEHSYGKFFYYIACYLKLPASVPFP
ncbi:hypothetical protein CFC21_085793 [Triticum aestivum]|uniref:F-box domain-containing protein n=2 Tax=Triticum aestivum TaxID=4565 RepID=A0A3B6PFZ9_WHEAT|nr:uncharacterized protein LOC123133071 [Triticum aestivum]KAF7081887.1 hypothetical protein CFC21_085793 [Triticum aestivum]